MTAAVDNLTEVSPAAPLVRVLPAGVTTPVRCRCCGREIRLTLFADVWTWTHAISGGPRCDGPEACRRCGTPIRQAGPYWVHADTGAFPCPELLRRTSDITFADPAPPSSGVPVAEPYATGEVIEVWTQTENSR